MEWFGHDLMLVLVDDISDPGILYHANDNSMALYEERKFTDVCDVLVCTVLEPADGLFAI